jgi:hypothetical protein
MASLATTSWQILLSLLGLGGVMVIYYLYRSLHLFHRYKLRSNKANLYS